MEELTFLARFSEAFQQHWPVMSAIALCGAFALAFSFERYIRLFHRYWVDGNSFMFEVQKYVLGNDLDGAIRVCNASPNAALPKVIKAGLQRASRPENQIQNAVDAVSLEMVPRLEKRLSYLAMIANVAVLFGLLGTIAGLIVSFASLETADPEARTKLIAAGISQAMNATAFGLLVSIFTMISHTILANKAQAILSDIDEFGVKLMDLLSARKQHHSSERS